MTRSESDRDSYVLSSGRKFYANRGLVGLAKNTDGWEVSEGYDGYIDLDSWADDAAEKWTVAEKAELADYMIALWQEFKNSLNP